jgi:hypothetical protein
MGLALREDVFACIANRQIALLDLRRDRYFALSRSGDAAFQRLLGGMQLDASDLAALSPLISQKILLQNSNQSTRIPLPELAKPVAEFQDYSDLRPSTHDVVTAMAIQFSTLLSLRLRPLHRVISQIQHRKSISENTSTLDLDDFVRLKLAAYLKTRKLLSTQDKCLHWSISMMNYLARIDYHPSFVIGVKMSPFAAHAWVQDKGTVLTDLADHVSPYTPILTI